jgi:hypothetical protein
VPPAAWTGYQTASKGWHPPERDVEVFFFEKHLEIQLLEAPIGVPVDAANVVAQVIERKSANSTESRAASSAFHPRRAGERLARLQRQRIQFS